MRLKNLCAVLVQVEAAILVLVTGPIFVPQQWSYIRPGDDIWNVGFCLASCALSLILINTSSFQMPKRKNWSKQEMMEAVNAVREKKMGYKAAARQFKVPRATLKDYVKSSLSPEECVSQTFGRKPTLSPAIEKMLVEYCLEMENNYYGLTLSDLRRMAYELAIRNSVPHPFNEKSGKAGLKWKRLFFKRHSQLSLRKPQNLSMARIQGFTKESVAKFFSILKPELERIHFDETRVFNVDETGLTIVQHKATKIVTCKGKKSVHKLSSAERGATITVVTCMSAAGQYVPPLMIFPQKRWEPELLDGAPPGSIGGISDSGWITGPLFLRWLEHFISIVRPSKQNPVVLILDGHFSHTRNIEVIDRARETGIAIVCLPPHSTDKMQPLDVAFMFPLKTYYAKAIENWLANHPGRTVRKLQVASLFAEAYLKAATMETAVNGFRKTGIIPFKPDVFPEEDFIAHKQQNDLEESNAHSVPVAIVSPKDVREVPVIEPTFSNRRGTASLVTGTPHKNKVLEAADKKEKVEEAKARKRLQLYDMPTAPKIKRRSLANCTSDPKPEASTSPQPSCSSSGKRGKGNKSSSTGTKSKKQKSIHVDSSTDTEDSDVPYVSTDDEDSEDDAQCPMCGKSYSEDKRGEKWISCTKCFQWFHETCSSESDRPKFICDICLEG